MYGFESGGEWETLWLNSVATCEKDINDGIKSLQTYLTKIKGLSGLILKNINFAVSTNSHYKFYNCKTI